MNEENQTDIMSHKKEDRPHAYKQDQVAGSPHVRDENIARMVKAQSSAGIPSRAIVASVGLAWDTIKKHYAEELEFGRADVESRLATRCLAIAEGTLVDEDGKSIVSVKESLSALRYYLGTRYGWKLTTGMEISGPDGKAIVITDDMSTAQAAEEYAKMLVNTGMFIDEK